MGNNVTAVVAVRDGLTEKLVCVPEMMLARLLGMAQSHVEDIESGLEEGVYVAADNADLADKRAAVHGAEALCLEAQFGPATMRREIVESVMMQDLVGEYDGAVDVLEWDWVQQNASFAHRQNGTDGVWEFMLNLGNTFYGIPAALAPTIKNAQQAGVAYLIFHQGT